METPLKPKIRASPTSRIALNEENGRLLEGWIDQLRESCPGIRVKKQDLVNWLVAEKGKQLSTSDLKSVRERFFDEIELAQWALGQLKAAKQRNEKVMLADLIRSGKTASPEASSKKKLPRKTEAPQIEVPPSDSSIRAD